MISQTERDLRHATAYAKRLLRYGRAIANGRGSWVFAQFDRDWPNIDQGFAWSASQTASQSDQAAAKVCVSFVSKMSLWPLDMWRPASERFEWLQTAASAAARIGDTESESGILNNCGIAQLAMGHPRSALEFHKSARDLAVRNRHHLEAAHAASSVGISLRHLGERDEALQAHREALKLAETGGFDGLCLNCHGNMAIIQAEQGNPKAAIEGFQQALQLARKLNRRREEGYALGNMGRAYAELGDLEKAADLHKQDLDISRLLKNKRGIANALGDLGNVLLLKGSRSLALSYHREQVSLAEETAQPREIAAALLNLSVSLVANQQNGEARPHFERATAIYGNMGNEAGVSDGDKRYQEALASQARTEH